jgi:glycosyltransferase involved in cell wall biosynthesis
MTYHQLLVSRDLGGAGLLALRLATWLARQGERVRVWVPRQGPASQEVERTGLSWSSYNLEGLKKGGVRQVCACLGVAARLTAGRGLAHVHTPGVYRLLRPALRLAGLQTVVHVQIDPSPEEIRWALREPPDLLLTCARYLIDPIRQALGERGESLWIEAAPNAVDFERFHPGDSLAVKRRLGAPTDRPLLLMLANLAPHKGQETAVRAVAELKGRGIPVECWLAGVERGGQEGYERRLRSLIEEMGVADRVRLLSFRRDSPDLLRAADFLLLPSTHEGLPLSVLEAQASKTVVLAAPTAGTPEAVRDGETGLLLGADDAPAYARGIEQLLRNPGWYHRIAEQALQAVRRDYDITVLCRRIHDLYRQVVSGVRGGGQSKSSRQTEGAPQLVQQV